MLLEISTLFDTNDHSMNALIKHIPNSKGTGCCSECTMAEVNRDPFNATGGDGYINRWLICL